MNEYRSSMDKYIKQKYVFWGHGIFQLMPHTDETDCMIVPFLSSPLRFLLKFLGTSCDIFLTLS